MPQQAATPTNPVRRYKDMLKGPGTSAASAEGLESLESADTAEPDLTDAAMDDGLSSPQAELHRIIKEHLGDKPELYEIADQIVASGGEALRILRGEDD